MNTLVFIPTYNDFSHLNAIADSILKKHDDFSILVIDDGSIDSCEISSRCLMATLPFNLGLGVATHIAFDHALEYGYDVVVRVDSDGQHNIDDIEKLIKPIVNGEADISIGSRVNRYSEKSVRIFFTKIASAYFRFLSKFMFKKTLPEDFNSGFMAFNSKAVTYLNGFELERYPEPQIILYALQEKLTIKTIDILQNPRIKGVSSIRLWQATMLLFRFTIYCILIANRRGK